MTAAGAALMMISHEVASRAPEFLICGATWPKSSTKRPHITHII